MPLSTTDSSNEILKIRFFLEKAIKFNTLVYLVVDNKKILNDIVKTFPKNTYYICFQNNQIEVFLADYSEEFLKLATESKHIDGYFIDNISNILNDWFKNNLFLEITNTTIYENITFDPIQAPKLSNSLKNSKTLSQEVVLTYLLRSIKHNLKGNVSCH